MDVNELIDNLRMPSWHDLEDPDATLLGDAADALSTLQAENEKLRAESIMHHNAADNYWHELNEYRQERNEALAELEQVTLENNALWTYIKIVDREYRRYMDRGYIDRLDELKRTWRRGQKED